MLPSSSLRLILLQALLTLGVSAANSALAGSFSGSSTTILRVFDVLHVELLENDQPIRRVHAHRLLDQHLRLSWDDLGERGAWSSDVALRWRMDWGSAKSDWQDDDLDILLAMARWRSRAGFVGLTLGRQQAITGMGWHSFDGARLDFEKSPRLKVFVHAGLPVDLWDGDGPDSDGFTWATGFTGVFGRLGSVGMDYELRRGDGNDLEETAGFDARFRIRDTSLAANADYSVLLDEFGETSVVLGQEVARRHHLEARFTRVRPIFPSDSIFAVFELNPYDETRLSYEFRGDGALSAGGYISWEDYARPRITDVEPDPIPDDLPEDIRRIALTARWEGRREAVHRSEIGWQRGWTGGRIALAHDSDWGLNPRWRIGCGLSVHRYENRYRLTEKDEIVGARARIRHDHDGKWDVALEVEQFLGRDRDTTRATLVFGTRFGAARTSPPWWGGAWTGSRPRQSPAPGRPDTDAEADTASEPEPERQ